MLSPKIRWRPSPQFVVRKRNEPPSFRLTTTHLLKNYERSLRGLLPNTWLPVAYRIAFRHPRVAPSTKFKGFSLIQKTKSKKTGLLTCANYFDCRWTRAPKANCAIGAGRLARNPK